MDWKIGKNLRADISLTTLSIFSAPSDASHPTGKFSYVMIYWNQKKIFRGKCEQNYEMENSPKWTMLSFPWLAEDDLCEACITMCCIKQPNFIQEVHEMKTDQWEGPWVQLGGGSSIVASCNRFQELIWKEMNRFFLPFFICLESNRFSFSGLSMKAVSELSH